MNLAPIAQLATASRNDRYPLRRLSTKALAFTPPTMVQDHHQEVNPTAALQAVTARHQTPTLRVHPLRNQNHPIAKAAAIVRIAVQNPTMTDRVTPMALEATLTSQFDQHARCHSTSKPSISQRRWPNNGFN